MNVTFSHVGLSSTLLRQASDRPSDKDTPPREMPRTSAISR
jgi:hypothetical protein